MVQTPASGAGIGQADMGCVIGCGRGKMTGGGARHRRNDVSIKHKQPTCHDFGIGECPKEMPVIIGIHLSVLFLSSKNDNFKFGRKCALKHTEQAGGEPKKLNNSVVEP